MFATNATPTRQHTAPSDLGATCEANRTTNQAVIADFAVMSYLHQVIDFYAGADYGVVDGPAVDRSARTYGDVVANTQPAKLGNSLKITIFVGVKPKPSAPNTAPEWTVHASPRRTFG